MIERLMRDIAQHSGVESLVVFEGDGFVIHATGTSPHPERSEMKTWGDLLNAQDGTTTVTLVLERGYVMLKRIPLGTVMVRCDRQTNLGSLRKRLEDLLETV